MHDIVMLRQLLDRLDTMVVPDGEVDRVFDAVAGVYGEDGLSKMWPIADDHLAIFDTFGFLAVQTRYTASLTDCICLAKKTFPGIRIDLSIGREGDQRDNMAMLHGLCVATGNTIEIALLRNIVFGLIIKQQEKGAA